MFKCKLYKYSGVPGHLVQKGIELNGLAFVDISYL